MSYFPSQTKWMTNTSRQIVVPMFLHWIYTDCTVYIGGSRSFSNKQGFHFFELLFFRWLFSWVSQSLCLQISDTEIYWYFYVYTEIRWYLCVCFLCFLVRNAVCTLVHVCTANLCRYEHTCMDPDVLFTVFKIMFYEILTMLTKTYF